MQQRATAAMMRLRRSTVEHPFASLKYRSFGHPRFLLRGLKGAQTEISLAAMVYNLKRMRNVLGGARLRAALVFSPLRSQQNPESKKSDVRNSEHRFLII
jgi:transposase